MTLTNLYYKLQAIMSVASNNALLFSINVVMSWVVCTGLENAIVIFK